MSDGVELELSSVKDAKAALLDAMIAVKTAKHRLQEKRTELSNVEASIAALQPNVLAALMSSGDAMERCQAASQLESFMAVDVFNHLGLQLKDQRPFASLDDPGKSQKFDQIRGGLRADLCRNADVIAEVFRRWDAQTSLVVDNLLWPMLCVDDKQGNQMAYSHTAHSRHHNPAQSLEPSVSRLVEMLTKDDACSAAFNSLRRLGLRSPWADTWLPADCNRQGPVHCPVTPRMYRQLLSKIRQVKEAAEASLLGAVDQACKAVHDKGHAFAGDESRCKADLKQAEDALQAAEATLARVRQACHVLSADGDVAWLELASLIDLDGCV